MNDPMIVTLIEKTAENTARRIVDEMRIDLSKGFERIGKLEQIVTGNGNPDAGIVMRVTALEGNMSSSINKWKYMAIGGYATLLGAAGILAALYKLHGALR